MCRCQRKPTHHPRVRGGQATCPGTQTSGQVPEGLLGPHARASKRSLSAASRPPEKTTLPKWGAGLQDSAQTALSPSPSVPQRRPLPSSPAQRPVPLRAASLLGPPRPSGVSCEPGPALWPNTLRAMSPRPAQRTARLVVLLSSSKDGGGGEEARFRNSPGTRPSALGEGSRTSHGHSATAAASGAKASTTSSCGEAGRWDGPPWGGTSAPTLLSGLVLLSFASSAFPSFLLLKNHVMFSSLLQPGPTRFLILSTEKLHFTFHSLCSLLRNIR